MPEEVSLANLFGCAVDPPPTDRRAWTMLTMTCKARLRHTFGEALASGTCVWIGAAWTHRQYPARGHAR
jgi:hypothetical protein